MHAPCNGLLNGAFKGGGATREGGNRWSEPLQGGSYGTVLMGRFFFFLLSFFLVPRFRGRSCGGELKTLVTVVLAGEGRGEEQSRSVARLRPQTGKMRDSTAAAAGAVAV